MRREGAHSFEKFGKLAAADIIGGLIDNPCADMTETSLKATIETTVDGIFDAVLKAGFLPERRVRWRATITVAGQRQLG